VHYTAGLGGLASLGGAGVVAAHWSTAPVARFLLEAAGAFFALYLVVMVVVAVTGARMRSRAGQAPAAQVPALHRRLVVTRHAR